MSEKISFISSEEAMELVGAIQEEEDIECPNHRILTVYNKDDREICWFDYDEVMRDIGEVAKEQRLEAVNRYILERIPSWAKEE